MEAEELRTKLCKGASEESEDRKIEKVLAPFMRTLKKKKRVKADTLPEEDRELYLKRTPKEVLSKLQTSTDPLSQRTLLNETGELLKVVTKSKNFNLYLTDYDRRELLLCPRYIQSNIRFEKRIPIEVGTYVAAYVAATKEYVIAGDILGDMRFPDGILNVGKTVKAVLCVPVITNVYDNCIGIVELYRDCSSQPYDLTNLQICTALTAWMGIAMEQNDLRLKLVKENEIQKNMCQLGKLYFSGSITFDKFISEAIKLSKSALNVERGSFYFFHEPVEVGCDEVLYADAYEEGIGENDEIVLYKKRNQTKLVKGEPGTPGFVARSGKIINIQDAYKDNRFDKKADSVFFRTRCLLGFPIMYGDGVIGVLKLVNSLDRPYFRKEDEELVENYISHIIALICGYYHLDAAYIKTEMSLILKNKLLDYHTKSTAEDVYTIKSFVQGDQQFPKGFFSFDWNPSMYEEDSVKWIAYAIMSNSILEPCFETQRLADFLLRLRKAHRPALHHNFEHAFCVFHCVYNIILLNKDAFTPVEVVTIVLVALCHDIDHVGLTNSFLSLKNDTVYQVYGDCCGEAHRYEVSMFFIQATELLSNISEQNYQAISKNMKKLMLGFDLAIHFENRKTLVHLINADLFDWDNPDHRYLVQNMILICADFSFNLKTFEVVKKFTSAFYKELFRQGDLEKSMGFTPLALLDRNKTDVVPENQIIFLNVVAAPCVEILVTLLPNLYTLKDLLNNTVLKWKETITLRGQEMWKVSQAVAKDRKDKRQRRVTLSSTFSSISSV